MVTRTNNIPTLPDPFIPNSKFMMNEIDYSRWVESYLAEVAKKTQIGYSPPTNRRTIVDFFRLAKEMIETRQITEQVNSSNRVLFFEDVPPEDLDTEAITFELITREPGLISQGSKDTNGKKEVSSHIRSVSEDIENPGQQIIERGKWYDHLINFYTYAKSSNVALDRVLWLERVFADFLWCFKYFGFTVIENGVFKKETIQIGNLPLTRYPISYFVRYDDLQYVTSQELREIAINLNII